MATTKQQFILRTLAVMNDAGMTDPSGQSYLGADVSQVDRQIEASFVDAWRRCAKVMPRMWFNIDTIDISASTFFLNYSDAQKTKPDGTGYVVLDEDFYLLAEFKLKQWKKPVFDAMIENEKTAAVQTNEYTRGSTIRPVCTLSLKSVNSVIKKVLNFYSVNPAATILSSDVERAFYVPVCTPLTGMADGDDIKVGDQVLEPLIYLCASTVFTQFEKYDISKALEGKAAEMLSGYARTRGMNVNVVQ